MSVEEAHVTTWAVPHLRDCSSLARSLRGLVLKQKGMPRSVSGLPGTTKSALAARSVVECHSASLELVSVEEEALSSGNGSFPFGNLGTAPLEVLRRIFLT